MISSSNRRMQHLASGFLVLAVAGGLLSRGATERSSVNPKEIQVRSTPSNSSLAKDQGRTQPNLSPSEEKVAIRAHHLTSFGRLPDSATRSQLKENYAALPLLFEANQGQTDQRVKFLSRGSGYNLFLTQSEVVLSLADPAHDSSPKPNSASSPEKAGPERLTALALRFAGAKKSPFVLGGELAQAKSNYFLGNDPAQWRRGVPNYAKVEYRDLYPGVDAVFHGESRQLEFDFNVASGADPAVIGLEVHGARRIRVNRAGNVVLRTDDRREIVLGRPKVYQEISGQRRAVAAKFVVRNRNRIGFSLGSYDHSQPLIIDPTLVYSTFVGPTQSSFSPGGISSPVNGVAVDASGFAYVVGTTNSPFFPIYPVPIVEGTPPYQYYAFGAYEPVCEGCDNLLYSNPQSVAFIAKFDTTKSGANSLIYSTYLGPIFFPPLDEAIERAGGMQYLPPSWASGSAIAVDPNGNAYVSGTVFANAALLGYFPTTSGALQAANPGHTNGFISELDPTGEQLLHSTYFGGNNAGSEGGDRITAIALDGSDNVYIAGSTDSPNMSTQCALQPFRNGNASLFVAKLDPALGQLGYSTYFLGTGGYRPSSGPQPAKAIAVDSAGEVYLVGGAYPPTPVSGNGSGSIGPGGGISVNPSCGFPYPNPNPVNAGFQAAPGAGVYASYGTESESGFLAKLNASGTQLLYLTYLGGNLSSSLGYGTEMDAVAIDSSGNAYVAGTTHETNLPTTAGVVGPNAGCTTLGSQTICSLNFLAEVNSAASGPSSLTFLTYLPQTLETGTATGVAVDQFGDILVVGGTSFNVQLHNVPNMPNPNGTTTSASTAQLGGDEDVATYLLELNPGATQILDSGYLGGDGICSGSCFGVFDSPAGMALDTLGNVYLAGSLASNDFPTTTGAFQPTPLAKNSNPNGFLAKLRTGPSNQPQLTVTPPIGNFGNVPVGQSPQITLTVSNTGQSPLLIQNVTTTGPFTLLYNTINCNGSPSGTLVGSLSPRSSCTANVMFNSSLAGAFTGALLFVDNSPQGTPDPNTPGYYHQSFLLTAIAPATHFAVSAPSSAIAGVPFNLTLTALNASNTTATAYTGTVHFTSTDPLGVLPTDYTFTAADNGSHVFTVTTLNTVGTQSVTATDTSTSIVTGNSGAITVNLRPATYFIVSAPSAATTGAGFSFTVTALIASNTTAIGYTGTAHFTSTDGLAILPGDYTFTAADKGTHVFNATLNTTGAQSITTTDTVTSTISGISNLIAVTPPPPPPPVQIVDNETIHVSDMESFPDLPDTEAIKVTDTVFVTPIIGVGAPVASFSAGALGFNGQSGSQSIAVSDIGQAPLTLASAIISGGTQFTITQISCSNGAASLSTVLASGAACNLTIGYTASGTPASDTATLVFTDNAALSNLASASSGSNFTQSISLNGSGASRPPPPPPPAIIPIIDNETISVTDTPSFPDVPDTEAIKVTDTVFVTPIIGVGAPVASFSAGALGFNGQSGSQSITVSDIGQASLTLASATISGGAQFTIVQISCSNGAASLSTVLASGAACNLTIDYAASGAPASDTATLVFTDNAALSNLTSTPSGSSYIQSISLNGAGSSTPPPPPPPAIVPILVNEPILVTDKPSFPDVLDSEKITVADTVTVTVLNTSAGFGVGVAPLDTTTGASPVTLTFNQVTQPGNTSLNTSSTGPAAPSGFQLGNPGVYYNLSTTATFTGSVTICINYTGIFFTQPPQLFHYQGAGWVNVTTSVNTTNMSVCGSTTSFSPFTLFQPTTFPTSTSISAPRITYGTPASVTITVGSSGGPVTGNVSLSVDGGGASTMTLSNGSASFSLGALGAGSHSLSASFAAQGNFLASSTAGTLIVVPATTSLSVTLSPSSIMVGQSTTVTVTLTAPGMVIPIDPSVLAPITISSPIVSDILTNSGTCTPVPASSPGTAACTITLTSVEPNGRTLNASFAGTSSLVASAGTVDLVVTAPLESKVNCIKSDFRNVSVPGGSYLWFNSIFKVRDVTKQKITITFFQSSVQFQYTDAGGNLINVNQPIPDAKVVIDPSVTTASTTFDSVNHVWITTVPFDTDDATFLTGIPWLVPAGGIPADIEPVTWCGTFASDTAGVDMGWRWSAAAYSSFSSDGSVLGVKPMNTDHDNPPANRDNAGTPENFKPSVIPGARGKGRANYTGSYSGSAEIE
jgi:hypothetical protein